MKRRIEPPRVLVKAEVMKHTGVMDWLSTAALVATLYALTLL